MSIVVFQVLPITENMVSNFQIYSAVSLVVFLLLGRSGAHCNVTLPTDMQVLEFIHENYEF